MKLYVFLFDMMVGEGGFRLSNNGLQKRILLGNFFDIFNEISDSRHSQISILFL